MKTISGIGLTDVQATYGGPEAELWELLMGEQIHMGGLASSRALADAAGITAGMSGVDLCCCTGAGMRFLLRFCGVARMTGVDATPRMIARGKERTHAAGLAEQVRFVEADATRTGLPEASVDFVWGEDAWCYVEDKAALVREAIRLVRPGGTVAFTDWVEGPVPLTDSEGDRFLRFMKFPSIADMPAYVQILESGGARVELSRDTGRFLPCVQLYLAMVEQQLMYDALRILGFSADMLGTVATEMKFAAGLAQQRKLVQGMFVARKAG